MPDLLQAVKRLFHSSAPSARQAGGHQVLVLEDHIECIEENIKAIHSQLDSEKHLPVVFDDTLDINGKLTAVEIQADRIHLSDPETHETRLVRLDDTLDDYQQLDEELREQLARKIARLVPELAHSKQKLVLDHAIKVLHTIARDQDERVRMMLAQELSDTPDVPYEIVRKLAHDPSYRVACPILEYSPLLRDQELLEIIATSNIPGVLEAIARRKSVSEKVGDALVNTHESGAIKNLLENKGAHISSKSMNEIIAMAPQHEVWHQSLISRPELTQKTVNRISGFISQHLLEQMARQHQSLKKIQVDNAKTAVTQRLNSWTEDQQREAELKVKYLQQQNRLRDDVIDNAIHALDEPFVIAALAVRAMITRENVKKILTSDSGRAITALAWEANLPMRTAMALQMKIGHIHHSKMVNARGGTDYPISELEMDLYMQVFR